MMRDPNADSGCYCAGPRELGSIELLCGKCFQWFHKRCLELKNLKCIPFMVNYSFICRTCNDGEQESFISRPSNFSQMCITALANLTCAQAKQGKIMFSKDKEIIPYIDSHWEGLTSMSRRVKQSWHQTVVKTMTKETSNFSRSTITDPSVYGGHDVFFGLVEQDLTKVGPYYEMNSKPAKGGSTVPMVVVDNLSVVSSQSGSTDAAGDSQVQADVFLPPPAPKTRFAKRKGEQQNNNSVLKRVKATGESTLSKLPAQGYPAEHPFNRDGYRYHLAEPDLHAPNRQEFDESNDTAGKPIPAYMYRVVRPNTVLLSYNDRAPQLKLSEDRLQVVGDKGYSVVRASHGVSRGSWYYEVTVLDQPDPSHLRIGWSQHLGCLQAPVGYDKFSYSWRSRKGTRFHDSLGKHYSDGYTQGDVLGFHISMPDSGEASQHLPITCKDMPLIKFKNYFYYEEKDEVQKTLKTLRPVVGSQMVFYKNGINQGVAFVDINEGMYYPAISLYKNAAVRLNFGPIFQYPPTDLSFKPLSDRANEVFIEQSMADILFFLENEGKLTFDA